MEGKGNSINKYNKKQSKGERAVELTLRDYCVSYIKQFSTKKCKYKSVLRFDFAVLDNQRKIKCFIEFDGKQHYEPIDYFGGEEVFKENKKRDLIKNEFCKRYNIPLIRISYNEIKSIDVIIVSQLTALDIIKNKIDYINHY